MTTSEVLYLVAVRCFVLAAIPGVSLWGLALAPVGLAFLAAGHVV